MEYITIAEAARRLGTVSDKTIRRAIAAGKLEARYPHPNKAEVSTEDLQNWYALLRVRPGETQSRLAELEARVIQLESEVRELRDQLESKVRELRDQLEARAPAKKPPKTEEVPPEEFTWLADFAAQHFIPYHVAADLFPRAIHGQPIKVKGRNHPAIGARGRRDFYIQLHTRADFRTCDDCPHEIIESGQSV